MAGTALDALLALLPNGPAWTRRVGSTMHQLMTGIAVEFARVQERLDQAQLEIDAPSTATETIADWEHMVGLPSECTPIEATLAARRIEAQRRWERCGQWTDTIGESFLIDRIVELGYEPDDIEIRRFHFRPMTCMSACNSQIFDTAYGWFLIYEFIVISGDDDARVICEIDKRYAQAHLGKEFAFPLTRWDRGTFTRTGAAVFTHPRTEIETALAADEMGRLYYGV